MFDMSTIAKRYFNVQMGDLTLDVEPPKVAAYKEFLEILSEESANKYDKMAEALQKVLSENRQGIEITVEMIENAYDTDEIKLILAVYIDWIEEAKNDPN